MADKVSYTINYSDDRFEKVEAQKQQALKQLNKTYDTMINQSDDFYNAQIDASKKWTETQKKNQQEQTDFAIEQIEQQKDQAKKDYTKEQSGAYVDWQKQSGEYGANAEAMAAQGMTGTGFAESSQVSMYNTYQNRVATAREAYQRAILNYDNAIKDARLQNNAALAEIAYQGLQTQLELALEGFQYKNTLIMAKTDKGMEVDDRYYGRYKDVLAQLNTENALAEEVRQYNESMAEEIRQYNNTLALQKAQFNWEKEQAKKAEAPVRGSSGGRGASNSNYSKNRSKTTNKSYSGGVKQTSPSKGETNRESNGVVNRHGDSWVEIPGHGRFSWTEVYAYVKDGTVKETKTSSGLKYTWVGKKAKNVTPDAKGYAAKQKELFGY